MGAKRHRVNLQKHFFRHSSFGNITGVHIIHDHVIIGTKSLESHNTKLDTVLQIINNPGLTLNLAKSIFPKDDIPFWGLLVTSEGNQTRPRKSGRAPTCRSTKKQRGGDVVPMHDIISLRFHSEPITINIKSATAHKKIFLLPMEWTTQRRIQRS